jgi:hypothetical protein
MNSVAGLPTAERTILFQETAQRRGMAPLIIEKDFWVCWTLRQFFDLPGAGEHLIFKGGTSLSKIFGVIERFSEDIDLSISRESLGYGGAREPEAAPSKKQAQQRIEELQEACRRKIADEMLPSLIETFTAILGHPPGDSGERDASWQLHQDAHDPQTLLFAYPSRQDASLAGYIRPVVRIELGARSDHWPAGIYPLTSYAAEEFPDYFTTSSCQVRTLEAERTFWEKATILHAEHFRPDTSAASDRVSRHYYDLYRMATSPIAEKATARMDILSRVAEHKRIYFRSAWARYEEARPGSLHLLPRDERLATLRADYDKMRDMFFGQRPSFEQILDVLREFEENINSQSP